MTAAHEDPEVRAAVLASITADEIRRLAKTNRLAARIFSDELMTAVFALDPVMLGEWSATHGASSGTLTAEHAARGPRYGDASVSGDNAMRGAL